MTELTDTLAFAAGHGGGSDWREAVGATLDRLGEVPDGANLGIVYVSDSLIGEIDSVLSALRAATGIAHWVGSVAMGVIGLAAASDGSRGAPDDADGDEYFAVPALSVLTMRLPPESFALLPAQRDDEAVFADTTADWLSISQPAIGLIHADPHHEELAELLGDLAEQVGYLVGGLSSAMGPMPVIADQVETGAACGVLFAPGLGIATSLSQGCCPIGPTRAITKVHENLLIALDGETALTALQHDIGSDKVEDLKAVANSLHVAFPVAGSDRADYAVRNLTGIDLAQGIVGVAATPDPGDRVMFCRRDADAARDDMRRMLTELRHRVGSVPKAGIYVSCLARGPNLFNHREELDMIREIMGEFPLAGFYANGEIAHNRIYGYTGVLTVFA